MPTVNGLIEPMLRVLEEAVGEGGRHSPATLGKHKQRYSQRHAVIWTRREIDCFFLVLVDGDPANHWGWEAFPCRKYLLNIAVNILRTKYYL